MLCHLQFAGYAFACALLMTADVASASRGETPKAVAATIALPSGLFNPMPGGIFAGYREDTGLDIAGSPRSVHAVAPGQVEYAEWGHTRWKGPRDTAFSVRVKLDVPLPWKQKHVTHIYYTHLSALAFEKREDSPESVHVDGGQRLGTSGVANGSPHLHLGFLLDGNVEQDSWDSILTEAQIRELFGNAKNGAVLPTQ